MPMLVSRRDCGATRTAVRPRAPHLRSTVGTQSSWCRRFEIPAPCAASPPQEFQIEKRHYNHRVANALWFSKFVLECAALYHELRKPSTSAADLKFLHRVPRVRLRNFKSKSGTTIIELLVPFGFRSSYRVCRAVSRTSKTGH